MPSYPLWLLTFAILPVLILWLIQFRRLIKYQKVFLASIVGSIIFSYPWDILAIREKIWYFTPSHILGIYLFNLPLEEWFFIIFETLLFTGLTIIFWEKNGLKE